MSTYNKSKWIEQQKENMKQNIKCHNNDIWCPDVNVKMYKVYTNSWFSIEESKQQNTNFIENNYKLDKFNRITRTMITVQLYPTVKQKNILNNWFNISIKMYNASIKFIKKLLYEKLEIK